MRSRYLLTEQIGAGGMGTVWRAWDRRDRRWVAAKVLAHAPAAHDPAGFERFVREQALRVRHRHVLQPLDCVVDRSAGGRGRSLFTMDLVRGGSLELLRRRGPLPETYVRVVLEQVLEALVAVHAAGVVHRDVKPGNLLLEPTGTGRPWVRLGDFGVAVRAGDPRLTRGVPGGVGTGGYLAPEQAAGAPPDPRQDLYAAGVLAREMLTGQPDPRPLDRPLDMPLDGPLDGLFGVLLGRLTSPEPAGRPHTAADALGLLRSVGVPEGAPWQDGPGAPDVVDLFGDDSRPAVRSGRAVATYVSAVVAVFAACGAAGSVTTWWLVR